MNEEVKQICTPCRGCVFATWEVNSEFGVLQNGCELGRLEKYRQLGAVVEAHDDSCAFDIINGRYCLAKRQVDSQWVKDTPPADRQKKVLSELELKLTVIVLVGDSLDGLAETTQSLLSQQLSPHEVFFVNNSLHLATKDIHVYLWDFIKNAFTWRITTVCDRPVEQGRAIDLSVGFAKGSYYAVLEAGTALPTDFISTINSALNDRLEQFIGLRPSENLPVEVVQTSFHRHPDICGHALVQTDLDDLTKTISSPIEKALLFGGDNSEIVRPLEVLWRQP